ncbi:DUF6920 family protein [Rhodococcus pseudokoreensis]|nr:DUF6544 family protein [Rhodococcus pseudokoreensis]
MWAARASGSTPPSSRAFYPPPAAGSLTPSTTTLAFTATQILVPASGFIWAATAKVGALPILGFDRFTDGSGEMRWRIGGVVPVNSERGRDVTESAAGRLAGEAIFVPTGFPLARWTADLNESTTQATWTVAGHEETVRLEIGEDGALRGLQMQCWGNPDGQGFGRYRFTVTIDAERRFTGITIPAQLRAGWETGSTSESEFFRAEITDARFRWRNIDRRCRRCGPILLATREPRSGEGGSSAILEQFAVHRSVWGASVSTT